MNARDMNLQLIDVLEKPVLNQERDISVYSESLGGRHLGQGRTIVWQGLQARFQLGKTVHYGTWKLPVLHEESHYIPAIHSIKNMLTIHLIGAEGIQDCHPDHVLEGLDLL
jgi:hypothetical protein